MNDNTIFVSIASYRDSECPLTLDSLYSNADFPKNIYVGICQQNDISQDVDCIPPKYKSNPNIKIMRIKSTEAKGPTYARYHCSTLYSGQKYYLQIDSHTVFVKGWDTIVLDMIRKLPEKSVLSYYPMAYDQMNAYKTQPNLVPRICRSFFNKRDMLSFDGPEMMVATEPYRVPFVAGGFQFSNASFLKDMPYDSNLDYLFVGEEILQSVRFFTNGWNVYSPHVNIVFHEYTRAEKPKIWTDIVYKDDVAFARVKDYLNGKQKSGDKYGIGTARTLKDFYTFAGIDFKSRKILKDFCQPGNAKKIEAIKTPIITKVKEPFVVPYEANLNLILLLVLLCIISIIVLYYAMTIKK